MTDYCFISQCIQVAEKQPRCAIKMDTLHLREQTRMDNQHLWKYFFDQTTQYIYKQFKNNLVLRVQQALQN